MPKQYELGTIPFLRNEMMDAEYKFLPELFLRAPYYSFARYDMERLPEIMDDQVFRNAIWLASPDFYEQLARKGFDFKSLLEKEKNTLYKYYNRMCFRPTPFGSFASFTFMEWGRGGTVHLESDDHVLMYLLPDQQLIFRQNSSPKALTEETLLTKNPTLYRFGSDLRFIKSSPDVKGRYHFTIDTLETTPFYRKLIGLFDKGYHSVGKLQRWITGYLNCTSGEADDYLYFLLEAQVLFSPFTGNVIYPKRHLTLPFHRQEHAQLWRKLNCNPVLETRPLAEMAAFAKKWLSPGSDNPEHVFYAALERPIKAGGPGLEDQKEVKSAIHALKYLSLPATQKELDQFIKEFEAKFDLEKVPILEALDPDVGINYNGLMGGVTLPEVLKDLRFPTGVSEGESIHWTATHRLLFRIWRDKDQEHYAPLQLKTKDLEELEKADPVTMPSTIAVMYRKTEDHLLVEHAGGVTANALIGRFTMFSESVREFAQQIAEAEQGGHDQLVFADIAQLSDEHVDNINRRRTIYPYEIPLNVYSENDYDNQIRPDDLYLSVVRGELILESKRLQKRVIPRLSTAYNYQRNELPLFRLLCDLQYQGLQAHLSLDLERFFPGMDFYPRVSLGHVILSCARWRFTENELKSLPDEREHDYFTQIRQFRGLYQLPQRVSLGTGDQQLTFDLGNRAESLFFLRNISGLKSAVVSEYLLPDRSVKAGNREMAAQYIAFLKHGNQVYQTNANANLKDQPKIPREYQLGSGWLYLKIYCTPESADLIIWRILRPFLTKNSTYIQECFFIRYSEGGYHLRLRLRARPEHIGILLTGLKKQLDVGRHQRFVRELRGDTYRRELERYGPGMMPLVENHFCASSWFVIKLMAKRKKTAFRLTEFQAAFFIAYHLLHRFLSDAHLVKVFTGNMADSFLLEFKANKELRMGLDTTFRSMKKDLSDVIEKPVEVILGLKLIQTFNALMDSTHAIAKRAVNKSAEQKSKLIGDLVHMHLNRSFTVDQRQQELLIYYYLHKYMKSSLLRQGKRVFPS